MSSVASTPVIPADGSLVLTDGTGSPVTLTVPYDNGNLKIDEIAEADNDVQAFRDRNGVYAVRKTGKKTSQKLTFTADLVGATDATVANLLDFIRRANKYSGNTSTLPTSAGDAYCMKVKWAFERTTFGASQDGYFEYKYAHLSASVEEGLPSKLNVSVEAFLYSTDYLTVQ